MSSNDNCGFGDGLSALFVEGYETEEELYVTWKCQRVARGTRKAYDNVTSRFPAKNKLHRPVKLKRGLRKVVMSLCANLSVLGPSMAFGYSAVALGPLMAPTSDVKVNSVQANWIATATALGIPLGCMLSSYTMRRGRKLSLLITSVLSILGWLIIYFSRTYEQILVGRIISGIATGSASVPATVYSAEVASPAWRSTMVTWTSVAIAIGQLAIGGFNVRPVSRGLGRGDLGRRPRNPDLVAGPRSSRRGARDPEEIPRHSKKCVALAGPGGGAAPTTPEEEAESDEAPAEEERGDAVPHYARLLLLPAVLRDLRGRLLRGEHRTQRWDHDRPLSGGSADRIHQVDRQFTDGWCVWKIREADTFDRFRFWHDDLHGDTIRLSNTGGQGLRYQRRRHCSCDLRAVVHFREYSRIPGGPVRHGGRNLPDKG
ncbi:uncharacterized protein LOC116433773 isoform X5 [Nomia melanderi]|uniref:uncharacterized protein LOC116433773 isoform X5 n=1 Tax=Nomia melanderi TaxID=2448451 RepID=UPI003FCDC0C1